MKDILASLNALRRPRLLISAARFGAAEYRRPGHLPRQLGRAELPRSGEAIVELMELEADVNRQRVDGAAGYSPARHVEILIALMGEARLLRATHQAAAIN